MECENDWTVEFFDFEGGPFEVRPITLELKLNRHKYNFCRAVFPPEVGEQMKPETRDSDGVLYDQIPVKIKRDEDTVARLMFQPDWAEYRSDETAIEFHDLQKSLSTGTIDYQQNEVELKSVYRKVLSASDNLLAGEPQFTLPDNQVRTIIGENGLEPGMAPSHQTEINRLEVREDETKKVVDSYHAVDFENIRPEKALRRLNGRFQVKSWVNRKGEIVIGHPEANSVRHLAAPNDERVWRYEDVNVTHPREPVKEVIVQGSWFDLEGLGTPQDAGSQIIDFFSDETDQGAADYKAMGVAERTDIDYGETFIIESEKAKKNALPELAVLALKEKMKQQNRGTVDIDPSLSGFSVSDPADLTPGDLLHVVPDDRFYELVDDSTGKVGDSPPKGEYCGSFVNNEAYFVNEITHEIGRSGNWSVTASIGMYPDDNIEASMKKFKPQDNAWASEEQIENSPKSSWFEAY